MWCIVKITFIFHLLIIFVAHWLKKLIRGKLTWALLFGAQTIWVWTLQRHKLDALGKCFSKSAWDPTCQHQGHMSTIPTAGENLRACWEGFKAGGHLSNGGASSTSRRVLQARGKLTRSILWAKWNVIPRSCFSDFLLKGPFIDLAPL